MPAFVKAYAYVIYALIALLAVYGILCIAAPKTVALIDFHYAERNNPSDLYILKTRIRGGIFLFIVLALVVFQIIVSH